MRYRHIKSEDVKADKLGSIVVQNLFADEKFDKLSIAKVNLSGEQEFGLNQESDLFYYVLEGSGEFDFGSEKITVKKADLIFIPKNTKYKDSGKLTLLAISTPKFDRNKRVNEV